MNEVRVRRLILASGSPRRRQLLGLMGLPFVIKAASLDEAILDGEAPLRYVERLTLAKASAIGAVRPDELVVAADTIVVLDGEILGKPADAREAAGMLRALRARSHVVYTGVAVCHPATQTTVYELGESTVWMRDYSDKGIREYVATGDPFDKAGAYAIQHPHFDPVARVEGCGLNVMGLPLCHLGRALANLGVDIPANLPGSCRAFNQRECLVTPRILEETLSRGDA